jgi:hypothetical protein
MPRLSDNQQHEVLGVIQGGMSRREIARRMHCSPSTITGWPILLILKHINLCQFSKLLHTSKISQKIVLRFDWHYISFNSRAFSRQAFNTVTTLP